MHVAVIRLFTLMLCAMAAPNAYGDDDLDREVMTYLRTHSIPGASIAIVHNGEVALARGFGLADVEARTPATEHTVYALASVTKQFTATAILMLVEQGKLSLDQKVTELLEGLPAAWNEVNLRHLLSHTSGIRDYAEAPDFATKAVQDQSAHAVIEWAADLPLEFKPGTDWKYSNTGYFLLGLVIEKVSGQSYPEFLRENIFKPLGMTSTDMDNRSEAGKHWARGYARSEAGLRNADRASPTVAFSAGGLVTTVLDLAKWDNALDRRQLLSSEGFAQLWSPVRLNDGSTRDWGMGWRIRSSRNCLSHTGHIQGFSTFVVRCPGQRFTMIVLANLEHANVEDLSGVVAQRYMQKAASR